MKRALAVRVSLQREGEPLQLLVPPEHTSGVLTGFQWRPSFVMSLIFSLNVFVFTDFQVSSTLILFVSV